MLARNLLVEIDAGVRGAGERRFSTTPTSVSRAVSRMRWGTGLAPWRRRSALAGRRGATRLAARACDGANRHEERRTRHGEGRRHFDPQMKRADTEEVVMVRLF
jgi:hypothetical protein